MPPKPPTSIEPASEVTLPRVLGLGMAIAVVVGNTIGSGIFVKPGRIAADAGNFPLLFSVWGFGAILCILGGLCLAELSSMHPRSGGLYVYLREAYGPLPAFLFGWQEFLFARPASTGALAVICSNSLGRILHWNLTATSSILLSIILIFIIATFNALGVLWGARLQATTTIIKCALVAGIALLPWCVSAMGQPAVNFDLLNDRISPEQSGLTAQVATVLLAVMWAFNGWEGVVPLSEEVRNPGRNLPLALLGGIGLLGLLYLSATLAYHLTIPIAEMADPEHREHVAEHLLDKLLGPIGGSFMSVGLVLSTLGTMNSNLLTSPRVTYAMGRDGWLPKPFGKLHATYRTPVVAIYFQAIMACGLVLLSDWLIHNTDYFHKRSIFDLLTDCIVFAASIFYLLAVGALLVLRRSQPDHPRPFRTPGYPWVPLAYLVTYTWFIGAILLAQPIEATFGLGLILLGVPYFYHRLQRNPATP
jgi:APA family basic amino acid/polyamine antiporter